MKNIIALVLILLSVAALLFWDKDRHVVAISSQSFAPLGNQQGHLEAFVSSAEQPMVVVDINLEKGLTNPTPTDNQVDIPSYCGHLPGRGNGNTSKSPNGRFSAPCRSNDRIEIRDSRGALYKAHVLASKWDVRAIAWSPDSTKLAVVVQQVKRDYSSTQGWLYMLSGHPEEFTVYRLFIVGLDDGSAREIPFVTERLEGAWIGLIWT